MESQDNNLEQHICKIYYQGDGLVTEPIRNKPHGWDRRRWRQAINAANRQVKKMQKQEARKPEAQRVDERLHAAGLYSSRDVGRIVPVKLDKILE